MCNIQFLKIIEIYPDSEDLDLHIVSDHHIKPPPHRVFVFLVCLFFSQWGFHALRKNWRINLRSGDFPTHWKYFIISRRKGRHFRRKDMVRDRGKESSVTPSKNGQAVERSLGGLVVAQRQSQAQQSANEQTWMGECAEGLEDCKAIASTLENVRRSSRMK